jgi:Nitrate and nitrite sensing
VIRKPPLSGLQLAALAAPVLAVLILLVFTIGSNVAASREAKQVNQATEFVQDLTVVVHELQEERDRTAGQAASGSNEPSEELVDARQQADQAIELWKGAAAELPQSSYGRPLRDALAAASSAIGNIGAHREQVDAGKLPKFLDASKFYIDVIGQLLVVVDRIADETTDPALRGSLRTVSALAWSKENASQERGLLNWMLTMGAEGVNDEASQAMLAQMSGAEFTWLVQFRVAASKAQEELFEQVVSGNEVNRVADLRARAISQPERLAGVRASQWMDAATSKADLMREVEQRLVDKAKADGASARSAALRGAFTGTLPTALVLLLAVAAGLVLARSLPQAAPSPRMRAQGPDPRDAAHWPEEPAAQLGRASTEVLRPFEQPGTGPRPAFGGYDQPPTGPQPVAGPGGWPGTPSGGMPTAGWQAPGPVEGQSDQWPAMPPAPGGVRPAGEWPVQPAAAGDQRPRDTNGGGWNGGGHQPGAGAPDARPGSGGWPATPPGEPAGRGWSQPPAEPSTSSGSWPSQGQPRDVPETSPWASARDADTTGPTSWGGAPAASPRGAPAGQPPASDLGASAGGLPRRPAANERLPIFEETRYDWFRTGGRAADSGDPHAGEDWSDLLTSGSADPSRLFGDPAGISEDLTGAGLPRRRQGASMAAGLSSSNGTGTTYAPGPPLGGSVRSPDDLRAALDSYQSGFERGRQEALRWFKNMPGDSSR